MKLQKRLAAHVLGCSTKKILFDENRLDEIKEAITKSDIRKLISGGAIIALQKRGVSKGRARKKGIQRRKGRAKGHGSRKGRAGARGENKKRTWINKVRTQRKLVFALRQNNKLDKKAFKDIYRKIKGGYFRSRRHIELYLEEKGILKAK